MTGVEIAALVAQGLQLIVKLAELVQAAQKGDVEAAEVLKQITERQAAFGKAVDEVHDYLDEKYKKP